MSGECERCRVLENELVESGTVIDWIVAVLRDQPISDFAESFAVVREAEDMRASAITAEKKLAELEAERPALLACKAAVEAREAHASMMYEVLLTKPDDILCDDPLPDQKRADALRRSHAAQAAALAAIWRKT